MESVCKELFARAPLILRLVASSVRISERAGEIIRNILHEGALHIVDKGINDLQTEADRSAQSCIVASLRAQFPLPRFKIIGEEIGSFIYTLSVVFLGADEIDLSAPVEYHFDEDVLGQKCPSHLEHLDEEDVVIWVDPLDGTQEFTESKNNPELREHVTVLIGIAHKGIPVAGVIHQPYYHRDSSKKPGRTIWGIQGVGTFGLKAQVPKEGEHIITTTRSHTTKAVNDAINALKPTQVLRVGGAGHKVLLVIEGAAHAYVFASPGCKKWDTCAPEAVLNAIGGKLTDLHGNRLEYHAGVKHLNSAGVLATAPGTDHQFYVDSLPHNIKETLIP